jgi:hypothetical protein
MRLRSKLLLAVVAMVVLLGVFLLYTQPVFMVQMANQMWACF